MGFIDGIKSIFNRAPHIQPEDPGRISRHWGVFRRVEPTLRLGEEDMLSVSTVYACIREIVTPIAHSDWKLFTRDLKGNRTQSLDDNISWLLNVRPNEEVPPSAFKEMLLTQTIIHGDGYAAILRDNGNRVIGFQNLLSEKMRLVRDGGDDLVYLYTDGNGATVPLSAADVIHIHGPSFRGLVGDSVLYRAAGAIALAAAQEKFGQLFFANNASLGGYIKLPGNLSSQDKVDRLKQNWNSKNAGIDKSHGTAVLENGAEYVALAPDAQKAQVVESRKFQMQEIARYFGVPMCKLGDPEGSQGYGTNIETMGIVFARDTLTPWVTRLTEEFTYKLWPKPPYKQLEIDLSWTTQGDSKTRAETRAIDLRNGVISRNEARMEEGRNSIGPEGDLYTVESSLIILSEKNLSKPEPQPQQPRPAISENDEQADEEDDSLKTEALKNLLAGSLSRFKNRLANRAADLKKANHPPDVIQTNLQTEQEKILPALVNEVASVLKLAGKAANEPDIRLAFASLEGQTVEQTVKQLVS